MLKFMSAEWLRMRRFWLTWVLLVLLLAILALQVNNKLSELEQLITEVETGVSAEDGSTLSSHQTEVNLLLIQILTADLSYPAFIGTLARHSTETGWFFAILFTVVFGGEDFSRRTIPVILTRGVSRRSYLIGRTLALWLAMGIVVLIIMALAAASGPFIHQQVTDDPITLTGLGDSLLWVLRSWITCLPFITAVLFWAVLARNMGPALGVGIGLHSLEYLYGLVLPFIAIVFANVDRTGDAVPWFYRFQIRLFSYTLGYNADIFLSWGTPYTRDAMFVTSTLGLGGDTLLPTTPERGLAFIVSYSVVFFLWTLGLFHRRDVRCGA
jgi:ABC-type transport system involved in multi-copper enzyme maturation permease subunit